MGENTENYKVRENIIIYEYYIEDDEFIQEEHIVDEYYNEYWSQNDDDIFLYTDDKILPIGVLEQLLEDEDGEKCYYSKSNDIEKAKVAFIEAFEKDIEAFKKMEVRFYEFESESDEKEDNGSSVEYIDKCNYLIKDNNEKKPRKKINLLDTLMDLMPILIGVFIAIILAFFETKSEKEYTDGTINVEMVCINDGGYSNTSSSNIYSDGEDTEYSIALEYWSEWSYKESYEDLEMGKEYYIYGYVVEEKYRLRNTKYYAGHNHIKDVDGNPIVFKGEFETINDKGDINIKFIGNKKYIELLQENAVVFEIEPKNKK